MAWGRADCGFAGCGELFFPAAGFFAFGFAATADFGAGVLSLLLPLGRCSLLVRLRVAEAMAPPIRFAPPLKSVASALFAARFAVEATFDIASDIARVTVRDTDLAVVFALADAEGLAAVFAADFGEREDLLFAALLFAILPVRELDFFAAFRFGFGIAFVSSRIE